MPVPSNIKRNCVRQKTSLENLGTLTYLDSKLTIQCNLSEFLSNSLILICRNDSWIYQQSNKGQNVDINRTSHNEFSNGGLLYMVQWDITDIALITFSWGIMIMYYLYFGCLSCLPDNDFMRHINPYFYKAYIMLVASFSWPGEITTYSRFINLPAEWPGNPILAFSCVVILVWSPVPMITCTENCFLISLSFK